MQTKSTCFIRINRSFIASIIIRLFKSKRIPYTVIQNRLLLKTGSILSDNIFTHNISASIYALTGTNVSALFYNYINILCFNYKKNSY
ncbi:hypothetical protein O9A_00396 [Bartonella koehlerae C-29]|uniref:Uncharacterized protein n=1 Tax=Bartonella koehlerae C-29 TaxID=1134510 RepID=A0A067WB73_9HYPH|nr:hypothetical protein O9A_00396 [Bartonella koehlerae C-29]